MADFSIEGLAALQKKQEEELEKEIARAQDSQNRVKEVANAQKTSAKQVAKEREKLAKLEEEKEKRILLMKISRRFEAFPWLQKKIPALSRNPSIPEMRETDELQKLELDLQGSEERVTSYVKQAGVLIEKIWGDGSTMTFLPEHLRLNLSGMGRLTNSPQFMEEVKPLIKETVIEHPNIGQMGLALRWANCFLTALITVHAINTDPAIVKMMEMQKKMQGVPFSAPLPATNQPTTNNKPASAGDPVIDLEEESDDQ